MNFVRFYHLWIPFEFVCLKGCLIEWQLTTYCCSKLVSGSCFKYTRESHHLQSVFLWLNTTVVHVVKIITHPLSRYGNITEIHGCVFFEIKTACIDVTITIAKPTTHLHKRVEGVWGAEEIADNKTFKRYTSCHCVSTNGDYIKPVFKIVRTILVFVVVKTCSIQLLGIIRWRVNHTNLVSNFGCNSREFLAN